MTKRRKELEEYSAIWNRPRYGGGTIYDFSKFAAVAKANIANKTAVRSDNTRTNVNQRAKQQAVNVARKQSDISAERAVRERQKRRSNPNYAEQKDKRQTAINIAKAKQDANLVGNVSAGNVADLIDFAASSVPVVGDIYSGLQSANQTLKANYGKAGLYAASALLPGVSERVVMPAVRNSLNALRNSRLGRLLSRSAQEADTEARIASDLAYYNGIDFDTAQRDIINRELDIKDIMSYDNGVEAPLSRREAEQILDRDNSASQRVVDLSRPTLGDYSYNPNSVFSITNSTNGIRNAMSYVNITTNDNILQQISNQFNIPIDELRALSSKDINDLVNLRTNNISTIRQYITDATHGRRNGTFQDYVNREPRYDNYFHVEPTPGEMITHNTSEAANTTTRTTQANSSNPFAAQGMSDSLYDTYHNRLGMSDDTIRQQLNGRTVQEYLASINGRSVGHQNEPLVRKPIDLSSFDQTRLKSIRDRIAANQSIKDLNLTDDEISKLNEAGVFGKIHTPNFISGQSTQNVRKTIAQRNQTYPHGSYITAENSNSSYSLQSYLTYIAELYRKAEAGLIRLNNTPAKYNLNNYGHVLLPSGKEVYLTESSKRAAGAMPLDKLNKHWQTSYKKINEAGRKQYGEAWNERVFTPFTENDFRLVGDHMYSLNHPVDDFGGLYYRNGGRVTLSPYKHNYLLR